MTHEHTPQHEEPMKPVGDSKLSASVLDTIDTQRVEPVPRWKFMMVEYSIWGLWVLTVLFGAIAFSVIIFVFTHAGFAFYEVTHEDGMRFLFEILPYMWVGAFALMAIVAHYNLRLTKKGYKYQVWQVLVSSIVASFVAGLVLHVVGVGFLVDNFIAKRIPMLPALERVEIQMWQHPEDGRMVGTYEIMGKERGTFTDTEGNTWYVYEDELSPLDLDLLHSGNMVRLIGVPATSSADHFHGCGVFPWMYNNDVSVTEIFEERDKFIERMQSHHERMFAQMTATGSIPEFITKPICGTHAAVLRMQTKFAQ